jgi:anti-sigma B factor antagonist
MTPYRAIRVVREAAPRGARARPRRRAIELDRTWLRTAVDAQLEGTVVTLTGDLDVATAEALGERLASLVNAGTTRIVVDVSDLAFCDASGIGTLVGAAVRAARHGGWLRIAAAGPLLRRIIEITRLTHTLPMYGTVEDALAGYTGGPRGAAGD